MVGHMVMPACQSGLLDTTALIPGSSLLESASGYSPYYNGSNFTNSYFLRCIWLEYIRSGFSTVLWTKSNCMKVQEKYQPLAWFKGV